MVYVPSRVIVYADWTVLVCYDIAKSESFSSKNRDGFSRLPSANCANPLGSTPLLTVRLKSTSSLFACQIQTKNPSYLQIDTSVRGSATKDHKKNQFVTQEMVSVI